MREIDETDDPHNDACLLCQAMALQASLESGDDLLIYMALNGADEAQAEALAL